MTPNVFVSAPVPGGRRDGDDRAGRAPGPRRRTRAPRPARSLAAREVDAPWPRPSTSRRRPARRPCPSSPKSRQRRRAALDGRGAPGSARPRRRPPSRRRPPRATSSDRVDDAGPRGRPGRSRRRPASRRPRRPARGAASIAPTPKHDPVAQDRSRSGGRRGAVTAGPRGPCRSTVSRRTVSQRRQPAAWNQRSVVDAVRVLEHPDLVEVALVGVGDPVAGPAAARRRT